jgi:hypothetical protein
MGFSGNPQEIHISNKALLDMNPELVLDFDNLGLVLFFGILRPF